MIHDLGYKCHCGGKLEILENEIVSIYCSECDMELAMNEGVTVSMVKSKLAVGIKASEEETRRFAARKADHELNMAMRDMASFIQKYL